MATQHKKALWPQTCSVLQDSQMLPTESVQVVLLFPLGLFKAEVNCLTRQTNTAYLFAMAIRHGRRHDPDKDETEGKKQ